MVYLLLGLIIAALAGYVIYLRHDRLEVVSINRERQAENERIESDIARHNLDLAQLKANIDQQNEVINSLIDTATKMRESAEQQAIESAHIQMDKTLKELEKTYQETEKDLEAQMECREMELEELCKQISASQDKLHALESKQLSYIQAQQRQEEVAANQDYYRLAIDEFGLNDITLLRDLQAHFVKKEIIDKVIWETYYRPAYDLLTSRLFANKGKVCGIYKITNLTTGQAYIGQSVDIKERFRQHIKTSLAYGPATNKLYQAMQKSGQHNFMFEVLEEVPRAQLNERETYWIEFYKTKDYGLNSTRGGS